MHFGLVLRRTSDCVGPNLVQLVLEHLPTRQGLDPNSEQPAEQPRKSKPGLHSSHSHTHPKYPQSHTNMPEWGRAAYIDEGGLETTRQS